MNHFACIWHCAATRNQTFALGIAHGVAPIASRLILQTSNQFAQQSAPTTQSGIDLRLRQEVTVKRIIQAIAYAGDAAQVHPHGADHVMQLAEHLKYGELPITETDFSAVAAEELTFRSAVDRLLRE